MLAWNSHGGDSLRFELEDQPWEYNSHLKHMSLGRKSDPRLIPMCLDNSLFLMTEPNLIPENTEATVYLQDPSCLTIFKHLALQGYARLSISAILGILACDPH